MSNALVVRSDADGVATLTLNRPDKFNALNAALFRDLRAHLDAIATETDTVGCVVLRGGGKCFSAGHDMNDLSDPDDDDEKYNADTIKAFADLPQPTISAVHGHCYTGGLELALGANMVIASENAKFADTHAKWGLVPIWGLSQRLPRLVGQMKAFEMMTTCKTYTAQEAEAIGLVLKVFPADAFDQSIAAYAKSIVENSWHAVRGVKTLLRTGEDKSLKDGLAYEIEESPGIAPDAIDRINAFLKK